MHQGKMLKVKMHCQAINKRESVLFGSFSKWSSRCKMHMILASPSNLEFTQDHRSCVMR